MSATPTTTDAAIAQAHWKVGRFYSSPNPKQIVLALAVGSQIEEYERHHSFIEWVHSHPSAPAAAVGGEWRDKLQRQCTEWGAYWRAPDAHGVELTEAQAIELLAEVLGVEVAIQRPCGVWPDGQKCTKAHGHQGPCD